MRTPSLYPEISDELRIISRAVISQESEGLWHRWREIKEQIKELAASATVELEELRSGYRIYSGGTLWECLNCNLSNPAGTKKCHGCAAVFKKPRSPRGCEPGTG